MLKTRWIPPPHVRPWKQQPLLFVRLREGWPCSRKGTGCPGDPLAESEHMLAEEYGATGQPQPPVRGPCMLPPAQSLPFPVPPRDAQLRLVRPAQCPGHRPVPNRPSPLGTLFLLPSQGRHCRRARRGQCQLQGPCWGLGSPRASVSPAPQGPAPRGGGGRALRGACPHRSLNPSPAPARGPWRHGPRARPVPLGSPDPFPVPAPGAAQMGKSRHLVEDNESAEARKEGR